ncbi:hypothetical protein [Amycolatopsis nalaikhensis]|uniref:Uncharacterized protein n=1 Tax=Amycolatopsis nalaikhensis TaxID=715472 RepID=A0ABY8XQC1_9PSEU|nr:hypothetical protein [Amycolatopsis sp. 2-2]WIV57796.1 hypothetical protein QP939_03675 [Amycolatopsis sp. 2-2]
MKYMPSMRSRDGLRRGEFRGWAFVELNIFNALAGTGQPVGRAHTGDDFAGLGSSGAWAGLLLGSRSDKGCACRCVVDGSPFVVAKDEASWTEVLLLSDGTVEHDHVVRVVSSTRAQERRVDDTVAMWNQREACTAPHPPR